MLCFVCFCNNLRIYECENSSSSISEIDGSFPYSFKNKMLNSWLLASAIVWKTSFLFQFIPRAHFLLMHNASPKLSNFFRSFFLSFRATAETEKKIQRQNKRQAESAQWRKKYIYCICVHSPAPPISGGVALNFSFPDETCRSHTEGMRRIFFGTRQLLIYRKG